LAELKPIFLLVDMLRESSAPYFSAFPKCSAKEPYTKKFDTEIMVERLYKR